jgi:hypothetical protein
MDKIEDLKKAQWYIEEMVKVHQAEIAALEAKVKADDGLMTNYMTKIKVDQT